MKTYTQGRNKYGVWTKNSNTANLSAGDEDANDAYRQMCAMKNWAFLERIRTLSTVAATQALNLPYDCDLVREISVVPNGQTTRYRPKLSPSPQHWDDLNLSTFNSDQTQWYIVQAGQLKLWPTPVQTGNTVYVNQKCRVIDLSIADITSITIASIANGATAMTVSGSLTTAMVGMWIRPTYTAGVASTTGDGVWYEITGVTNATTLTLGRAYGGVSITAATAACTIGQVPLLPESFQQTPWKLAAANYWGKEDDDRADRFQDSYDRDILSMIRTYSLPTGDPVLREGPDEEIINPNLTIRL